MSDEQKAEGFRLKLYGCEVIITSEKREREREAASRTEHRRKESTEEKEEMRPSKGAGAGRIKSSQVKSGVVLRDTWSRRQAGAMRPVRRAGWVWAANCASAAGPTEGL